MQLSQAQSIKGDIDRMLAGGVEFGAIQKKLLDQSETMTFVKGRAWCEEHRFPDGSTLSVDAMERTSTVTTLIEGALAETTEWWSDRHKGLQCWRCYAQGNYKPATRMFESLEPSLPKGRGVLPLCNECAGQLLASKPSEGRK